MAEKTPDSVTNESMGSMRLVLATFSTNDVDDGDTWVSGIPNAQAYWFNRTDDPTQEAEIVDVAFSAGTFTFNAPEDNCEGILYVLTKS